MKKTASHLSKREEQGKWAFVSHDGLKAAGERSFLPQATRCSEYPDWTGDSSPLLYGEESLRDRTLDITGYGLTSIQVARDANWQLAYQRAFEDYLKQLDKAAANNGL